MSQQTSPCILGLDGSRERTALKVTEVEEGGTYREVGVAAGAVPVTGDGLGVERDDDAELLAHALQDVAGHPHLVARGDALRGADLVLPLAGQHLAVDARDLDAGVQAGAVVGLGDVAAEGVLRAHRAVVGALGAGVAT